MGGGPELPSDKAAPSAQEPNSQSPLKSMLVISGGEGYIDFRMGMHLQVAKWPCVLMLIKW